MGMGAGDMGGSGGGIVRESTIDRDALLTLADEMDGAYPDSRDVAVGYIEDYARSIREALGVSDD